MKEIIIIGGGPAAVSAALYTSRAGIKTRIISNGKSALLKADKIENYFGTGVVSGEELLKKGYEQTTALGVENINDEVLDLYYDGAFKIKTVSGEYKAGSVIIATGSERRTPNINGLQKFEGAGVSYCATCDGFFFKNRAIGIFGTGKHALHEYEYLSNITDDISLFTNGDAIQAEFPGNIKIYDKKIKEIIGGDILESIILDGGESIEIAGLFIALGTLGASTIARKVGAELENGLIKTDISMETSVKGLFAAGDCVNNIKQVSVAVGEGAKAALAAIKYIKNMDQR